MSQNAIASTTPHTLSIIIPVYNEEKTIGEVLSSILQTELIAGVGKEIVIVNDCSTDRTEQVILDFIRDHPEQTITYAKQPKNQGKGAALHKGIDEASGQWIVIQDADLEYDPQDFNLLLQPVLDDRADVVYGSRFIGGAPHRILFFWHSLGNRLLTFLSNMFTNLNLTDMETCLKLFRAEILKSLTLKEKRFGFEPEVTAKIARLPGVRIYEVGVSYHGRTYAEGKKVSWRDGVAAIYCIIKYGFLRSR